MAILKFIEKHPDEIIPVVFLWADNVSGGQTLTAHSMDVGSLTLSSSNLNGTTVTAYISGGTDGQVYTVECKVTRSDTAVLVAEIEIRVKDY